MSLPEYCFVCFHDPSVHGLISGDRTPCLCCESPAAVDAARTTNPARTRAGGTDR